MPLRTAAMSTFVVVRNGRYRASSASMTAGNAPKSLSTTSNVSYSPSIA